MAKTYKVLIHDDIKNKDVFVMYKYLGKNELSFSSRVLVSYGYKSSLKGYVIEEVDDDKDYPSIISCIDEVPLLFNQKKMIEEACDYYLVSLYKLLSKILPFPRKEVPYQEAYYVPILPTPRDKLNKREYDLLQLIKTEGKVLVSDYKKSSLIKTLLDKKYIKISYLDEEKTYFNDFVIDDNDEQIVDNILNSNKKDNLIETNNTYEENMLVLKLCKKILSQNKSVLILNPYLSKADPLFELLNLYFEKRVYFLKSKNTSEYIKELKRINNSKNIIIMAEKEGVFSSPNDLGLVIIKGSENSSYSDRELGINYINLILNSEFRSILFSIAPGISIKARQLKGYLGGYQYKLKDTISYNLINREEGIFPNALLDKIRNCLNNKEQVLIYHNLRGNAQFYQCNSCKKIVTCPTCNSPLTYYKDLNKLRCLGCGYEVSLDDYKCVSCGESDFSSKGIGTMGIQEYLLDVFCDARISRLDADSIKDRDYQMDLSAFAVGDNDILIGTKGIITQSLLPKVKLIIVMDIDWILNVDDYYIEEKYYDLLAGLLSASSSDSLAYIISGNTSNKTLLTLAKQDYLSFYNMTMEKRKMMLAPPYVYICEISLNAENYDLLFDVSNKASEYLINKFKGRKALVIGPSFKRFNAKAHRYISSIMIKYKNKKDIDEIVGQFIQMNMPKGINLHVEVDKMGE